MPDDLQPDDQQRDSESADQPTGVDVCPACAEPVTAGANWCEACGHDLVNNQTFIEPAPMPGLAAEPETHQPPESRTVPSAPCQACGETDIDADGYCLSCGYRQPSERNHISEVVGSVAAATDRGSVRHRNEDAYAIAVADAGQAILVVCDGVSSTPGSEEASTSAAKATCRTIVDGLNQHDGDHLGESEMDKLLRAAVADGQQAAAEAAATVGAAFGGASLPLADPPSTTLVCAVVSVDERTEGDPAVDLDVAWVGDSRCYWVTADEERLLTSDHEELGALSRWLGADSMQPEPDIVRHRYALGPDARPGLVLVCSDGLWRYLSPSTGMPANELVAAITHNLTGSTHSDESLDENEAGGETARSIVESLIEFANNRGGHDNITAAITSPVVSLQPSQESQ